MSGDRIKIMNYWDKQAVLFKESDKAVSGDRIASELEVAEILKHLNAGDLVMDMGCGNGWKDVEYAKTGATIDGFDYSAEMIRIATEHETPTLHFAQANVLEPNLAGVYDVVISDRCLINLTSEEEQLLAFDNLARAVKRGGKLLLMESTEAGLENINRERAKIGFEPIEQRWHNKYLSGRFMQIAYNRWMKWGIEVRAIHFNSTYFLISRTLNAALGGTYDSTMNELAAKLTPSGEFSPLCLYVYTK